MAFSLGLLIGIMITSGAWAYIFYSQRNKLREINKKLVGLITSVEDSRSTIKDSSSPAGKAM